VAIPSYNRPAILEIVLERLLNFETVDKIFVVADASSQEILSSYENVLSKHGEKVVAELNHCYRGSTKTRNALLELVAKNVDQGSYVMLLDDDFLVPNAKVIELMFEDLKTRDDVGIVGGRIVNVTKKKVDPEFSLNLPKILVDWIRIPSGWLFLVDRNKHEVGYGKGTTAFMLLKRKLIDYIRYDENYRGTGYREESDLHRQAFRLGFRILSDYRAYVFHIPMDEGGNRVIGDAGQRFYWKAHNHTYFVLKWNDFKIGLWYMLASAVLLIVYRPLYMPKILLGLQHGYKTWKACMDLFNIPYE